jgi:TRAP-type C4-dicarboxylate transport system permease small subunit
VRRNYNIKINTQVLDLPYWCIYLVIPIAFILVGITCFLSIFPKHEDKNTNPPID